MREVVAECEQAGDALFDRQGQRGDAAPGAARRSIPAKPPFPLLHVDTTWKFRDMYAFRDAMAQRARHGAASCTSTPEGLAMGINPFTHGSAVHTDVMKTQALQAGARQVRLRRRLRRRAARRGEEPRQGARLLVPHRRSIAGTRRTSGPSCGSSTTRASAKGESLRVFPLSNWTELDIWQYIHLREHPDRAAVLRRASGRWSSATAR